MYGPKIEQFFSAYGLTGYHYGEDVWPKLARDILFHEEFGIDTPKTRADYNKLCISGPERVQLKVYTSHWSTGNKALYLGLLPALHLMCNDLDQRRKDITLTLTERCAIDLITAIVRSESNPHQVIPALGAYVATCAGTPQPSPEQTNALVQALFHRCVGTPHVPSAPTVTIILESMAADF